MLQKPLYNRNQLNENPKYIRRVSYVTINSKDRDTDIYEQPESYTIDLKELIGTEFKNVESFRLLHAELPDLNSISDEPYLILCIKQIQDTYSRHYHTSNIPDLYDILTFSSNYRTSDYIYVKEGKQIFFKPSMARLSKLSISIRDQEGNLFSWGDDSGVAFSIDKQHSMTFEIVELVQNINCIQPMNVY
jgi:hypothetical protein